MVNVIVIIIMVIVLSLMTGAFYEFFASQSEKRKFKEMPGQLIDIGDYQLHINMTGERGENQPVVILESSVGSNSLDWQLVQPLIAEYAQVISYDRAGNGWSETASTSRTPDNLADDLHKLLQSADIEPPYILVGHRYGGMFARKFQEKYPGDVAAIVLVDSSHPDAFDESNEAEIKRLSRNVNFFQKIGLVRRVTQRNYRAAFLDGEAQQQYIAKMMQDNPNLLREATPILRNGIELPESLDTPVTIISRAEDIDLAREREWADRQRDLATLSDNSKHIFAESTKSWIVFSEPQTIADAIQELLKEI